MLNLILELRGIQLSHQHCTIDGCRSSFESTKRVTENVFGTGVSKVFFTATVDGINPIDSSNFGSMSPDDTPQPPQQMGR